ncbi:MAG: hypothetical protein FIB01_12840 [Gemmatimonadetes bacterium]|nr:hypothetical protein [Gemmatimonadota bacterium]
MRLRGCALTCTLLALLVAPRGQAADMPAPARGPDLLQGCHQAPLPFLGSGGVAVQVPATEPLPPLPLLRACGCGRMPALPTQVGRGRRAAALPLGELATRVRACRTGTPPPAPRSGWAAGPAEPVRA